MPIDFAKLCQQRLQHSRILHHGISCLNLAFFWKVLQRQKD